MIGQIPLAAVPSQNLQITLDGQDCRLAVYQRERRLFMDLECDGLTVFRGQVCVNRTRLVQSPTARFAGQLVFTDQEGDRPPHWRGLGSRWLLLYLSGPDLEEATA